MTHQDEDWVFYKERRYELLHDSSGMLPMFGELGIKRGFMSTANRRGYIAEYEIDGDLLYLATIDTMIRVGPEGLPDMFPPIGDVYPFLVFAGFYVEEDKRTPDYRVIYSPNHPMRISGTMTINCYGVDNRQESAEGGRWRQDNPFPPETLKIKIAAGHIQSIKDVTESHESLTGAMAAIWQDQFSKLRQIPFEEWTKYRFDDYQEAQKRYQEFLLEEF